MAVVGIIAFWMMGQYHSMVTEQENVETPQYVTVSINEEFLESGTFDTHVLKEGDEVEFLYFMGGGR